MTKCIINFTIPQLISKRIFCSANSIKTLNSTSKTLFGAVTKTKDNKSNVETKTVTNSNDRSSEIYWLMHHGQKSRKTISSKKSVTKKSAQPVIEEKVNTPEGKKVTDIKKAAATAPIAQDIKGYTSLDLPVIQRTSMPIPFTHAELTKLINFPLISETPFEMLLDNKIPMPSVGKVLQATMSDASRKSLMHWKLLKIAELGEEGFMNLQKSHLSAGSNFHQSLQHYFESSQVPDKDSSVIQLWNSVNNTLGKINPKPELCEAPIIHPALKYKGIVDCVSSFENEMSVIEWKKSDRRKPTIAATYDAPLQLCAYLGALNADPKYGLKIRKGLIVIAYVDGKQANTFQLDEVNLRKYWRLWLLRLQEYWIRYRDGTLPEPI